MLESDLHNRPRPHPVLSLIIILLIVGIGFVIVGPTIGFLIALPFYPGSMQELVDGLQNPIADPNIKIALYIMQGFATLVGLIIAPVWYMSRNLHPLSYFFRNHKFEWIPVLITSAVVIVFMAVNSVFIEWNQAFRFPEVARDFETWARERENAASELTEFLTQLNSPIELLIAIFVIAILPAIGEEIVFRGLIQNELYRATRNIHVSIWLAAILFSAIHIQFFGFVPRLLLGALFGYLYYWSGNLSLAMLAHFVNNGVSVLAMYLHQQGAFEYDLESPEAAPANVVIFSTMLTIGLLYYFYKYFERRNLSLPPL